ncbi:MAG TPA: ATP-binding protein, partial [Archangium sp.]|nr:ATP-binding protein [Archangium sp.]
MSATSTSLRAAAVADGEQQQTLAMLLRALKLPAFAAHHEELARRAGQEGWTCPHYLRQLVELELSERRGRRIERLLKASGLSTDKT